MAGILRALPSGTRGLHGVAVREAAGAFDYRYDAPHPVTVPSDRRWHGVQVHAMEVGLSPEYVCVPAEEACASSSTR